MNRGDLYAEEYDRKQCEVFYCDNLLRKQCCYHCSRKRRCKNKCLNEPTKCGLLEENK